MKKSLLLASFLCAVLAGTAQAADQNDHKPGFRFGDSQHPWVLTPTVSFGVFWETNAHDSYNNKESGAGYRIQPRISLTNVGRKSDFGLNAFYTIERGFDSDKGEDSDSYGASLGFRRQITDHQTVSLFAGYNRMEDDDFYYDGAGNPHIDPDKTEHYNVNLGWGYRNEKWQGSVGVGWNRTHYLADENTSQSYSNDVYNVSGLVGRAYARNHYWNVSLSASMDDPQYGDSSMSYYLMTGSSGNISKDLSYSVMVGISMYDYDGKADDDTEFGPSYNASLSYRINRTFSVSATASSRYESDDSSRYSSQSYYSWTHTLTGSLNAQWTSRLTSRLNAAGIYEDHTGSGGARDYERTYAKLAFTTSYRMNDFASIYGGLSYSYDEYDYSSLNRDKDNFRVDLGLSFTL